MRSMPTLLLFVGLMAGSAAAQGAELTAKKNLSASQNAEVAAILDMNHLVHRAGQKPVPA